MARKEKSKFREKVEMKTSSVFGAWLVASIAVSIFNNLCNLSYVHCVPLRITNSLSVTLLNPMPYIYNLIDIFKVIFGS